MWRETFGGYWRLPYHVLTISFPLPYWLSRVQHSEQNVMGTISGVAGDFITLVVFSLDFRWFNSVPSMGVMIVEGI